MKKTKWLLLVLLIGLGILVVIEPPISASDQPPTDAALAAGATVGELKPAGTSAETAQETESEFDSSTHGTY